jgi:hypothetical protein
VSRLRRIEVAGRYFFVTTNLLKHSPPLSPSERDICLDQIDRVRTKHKFALFAKLMRDWKSASGFAIAKARSKRGAIWQERYFDFILRRARDFGNKLEYIHANPVEATLAPGLRIGHGRAQPSTSKKTPFASSRTYSRLLLIQTSLSGRFHGGSNPIRVSEYSS